MLAIYTQFKHNHIQQKVYKFLEIYLKKVHKW